MKIWVRFIAAGDINSTLKYFCATLHIFVLLAVTCSSGMHRECIYAFPLQQWLRERTVLLRYTYIAYVVWNIFRRGQYLMLHKRK